MKDKIHVILMRVLAVMLVLVGLPFVTAHIVFIVIPALGAYIFYFSIKKSRSAKAAEKARLKQEKIQKIKEDPKEMDRLVNMCERICSEYKILLERYKDLSISDEDDVEKMVYILKECYRKMDVLWNTVHTYQLGAPLDPHDEQEKIEKKARTFINGYIKQQREDNYDDYMIDVMQFSDDLGFIWDYINDKDEKLNRE